MSINRSYAAHKGFRIFLPGPDSFRQNAQGVYLVHVEVGSETGDAMVNIPIADCVATSYQDALQLSVDNAMNLINLHAPEVMVLQGHPSQNRDSTPREIVASGAKEKWHS